ncbi:hypothetical protein HaLaN_28763, partial [Haematococcus lacustris]
VSPGQRARVRALLQRRPAGLQDRRLPGVLHAAAGAL